MNMDYSKVFELLNQDAEKERNEKLEKVVHDNLYNKGFRDGLAVLGNTLLIKSLINDFRDYQKEWLTSHNDIAFDRLEEDLILGFLDDTAKSYISEHIS